MVRGPGDAAFGEDGGDVARGGDIKGGMRGVDVGSDAHALEMGDFGGGALFDGDVLAVGDGKIEGGDGRGDVEGNVVLLGEDSDLVSADFVGGVAVGRDAVGAGDDGSDLSGLEEVTNHVVGDERKRNAALVELPGGEARTLKIRASFRNKDVQLSALLEGDTDNAEGRADAACGERAGVALGHDLAFTRHEFRAVAADGFVGGALFEMDLLRFFDHALLDFREVGSLRGEFGEAALHALKSPEKIHGGGAGFCERGADFGKFGFESADGFRGGMQNAERGAHGGGDADGGSAADDHFADGFGDVAVVGVGVGDFLGGKAALVEYDDAAVGPFDRLGYVHLLEYLRNPTTLCRDGRSMLRPYKISRGYLSF